MAPDGSGPAQDGSGWIQDGGWPSEFMNTTSYTGLTASAMNFTFNGTSIAVYGTVDNYATSTWNFTVDGAHEQTLSENTPIPSTKFHQQLYSSGTLEDGEHLLELMVVNATATTDNFFIDYLVYTPLQNTSLSKGTPYLFIDDTSPYVHYSPSGWTPNTISNSDFNDQAFMSYNDTINMASSEGAYATVHFQGSAIESTTLMAWGAYPVNPYRTDIASYTLDDGNSTTIYIPLTTSNTSYNVDGNLTWNYQLLSVEVDGPGVHTLNLTALGPNLLYLDLFLVKTHTAFMPAGEESTISPPSNSSSHTGAIVGGVIGGVVLIGLTVIGFLFRRRQRQEGQFDHPDSTKVNYGQVMNTYHGADDLPHAPSYPTTDASVNATHLTFSGNQLRYNGVTSPNNLSDSSSYSTVPFNYGEGERRLSQGNRNVDRPPMQMENMVPSSWSPPSSFAGAIPGSMPLRSTPALPGQQTDRSQGLDTGKPSVPPDSGVREHEPAAQEQGIGYRGLTNSISTAPPSYTYE